MGAHLQKAWESQTPGQLSLRTSSGSQENYHALRSSQADLALIQGGVVDLNGLSIIAPISSDLVHVLVRKDAAIKRITDLKGHAILVGMPDSGMASSAEKLLHFYGLDESNAQWIYDYFTEIEQNRDIDAAIVTAGILNDDLNRLLLTGGYRILPDTIGGVFGSLLREKCFFHASHHSPRVVPHGRGFTSGGHSYCGDQSALGRQQKHQPEGHRSNACDLV